MATILNALAKPPPEGVTSGYVGGVHRFESASGAVAEIQAGPCDLEQFTFAQFRVLVMRTRHTGERQWSALKISGDSRTLGYVFPVATLREAADVLPQRWPRLYLAVAVYALLYEGLANDLVSQGYSVNSFAIDDIYPDDLAVVVLGREQLDHLHATDAAITVMLHASGFRYYRKEPALRDWAYMDGYQPVLLIPRFAKRLAPAVSEISALCATAFNEAAARARFISLYQLLELLIAEVFSREVRGLLRLYTVGESDAWDMKDGITEYAGERWRLKQLGARYLSSGASQDVFANCSNVCHDVLNKLGLAKDPPTQQNWPTQLYLVRNLFVHQQLVLSQVDEESLFNVCDSLASVCLELLSHFEYPPTSSLDGEHHEDGSGI